MKESLEVNELILLGRKLGSEYLDFAQLRTQLLMTALLLVKAANVYSAMSIELVSFCKKIHKGLSLSWLEVVVKSMCNALWKSWVSGGHFFNLAAA